MNTAASMQIHIDWESIRERHASRLAKLEMFLESYEREHSFYLTPSAVEVLFLPIVESLERGHDVDDAEVARTFHQLVSQMVDDPDPRDRQDDVRSAWSALRAVWGKWCDIPPICRPSDVE